MKDLGITKGELAINYFDSKLITKDKVVLFANTAKIGRKENDANLVLVLDSFNTAQKCGLLPSELLEQRDQLLRHIKAVNEVLEDAKSRMDDYNINAADLLIIMNEKAIKNATS